MTAASEGLLLVDDSEDEIAIVSRALKKNDLAERVTFLADGQEALDYLLDPENPLPRVVFLDLKMPRIGGLEVLRRMRSEARTRYLPVVIVSSSTDENDVRSSYELGANSYINKVPSMMPPAEYVVQAARYWLDRNEPLSK